MESGNREGAEEFLEQVISLQPRVSQSWVSVDGVSDWEGKQQLRVHWKDVLMSGVEPPLGTLRLRDPDGFIAGGLHTNPNAWELILRHHPLAQEILGWIRHRVDILHFSLHGFRSGAAVSMALAGVDLHAIMNHVGWKRSETALHYIKLRQVINPAGAAARLADLPSDAGKDYKCFDALRGFFRAF